MSENPSNVADPAGLASWSGETASSCPVVRPSTAGTSTEKALRERVKTLNCLLSISQAVDRHSGDLQTLLAEIVRLLPPAWQYPDTCRARLVLDDQQFCSPAFHTSSWKQKADIIIEGQNRGFIEVYYLRRMPDADEGAFYKEERELLSSVAEKVARLVERQQLDMKVRATIKELQVERTALQQTNTSLHSALERAVSDKKSAQEAIVTNVDRVLMPVLRALEQELPFDQKKYASLLRNNLEEITSPFADKLSRAFMSLTAAEIRICQMIRDGRTTKEIAQVRQVSPATVARQRERIRHKLGLTGTDANLATYLRTFLVEGP